MILPAKGIDLSYANTVTNYNKLKTSGVSFAIIRTGYRRKTDTKFEHHMKNVLAAGLNAGAYCYCLAKTPEEARTEAEYALSLIKPYNLTYPLFYDVEDREVLKLPKKELTKVVLTFLETAEKAGYRAGLYTNPSVLEGFLEKSEILPRFDLWLAHWTDSPDKPSKYDFGQKMWQWGAAYVSGAMERLDCDLCYVDYPALIAADNENENEGEKEEEKPEIGDSVIFSGGNHYPASVSNVSRGKIRTAGMAKVTNIAPGTPHPYHLIGETSNVYGWVNENTVFVHGEIAQATDALNLRESPYGSNVPAVIYEGETFAVFDERAELPDGTRLRKAAYRGYVGYVNCDYLILFST